MEKYSGSINNSSGGRKFQLAVRQILHHLKVAPEGLTTEELSARILDASMVTVRRALKFLESDFIIKRNHKTWKKINPQAGKPLLHPQEEDFNAVLTARALISHVGDPELDKRFNFLLEELESSISKNKNRPTGIPVKYHRCSVAAVMTWTTDVEPMILRHLFRAIRRETLKITYCSPWTGCEDVRIIEPWMLMMRDMAHYLRAWDCTQNEARTFRVTNISKICPLYEGRKPRQPVPTRENVWGDEVPAFGIDVDRPNRALIVVGGAVARWLHRVRWHPNQDDDWDKERCILRRTLPYRSCREMARRILSVLDGLVSVEPKELKDEIRNMVEKCEALKNLQ